MVLVGACWCLLVLVGTCWHLLLHLLLHLLCMRPCCSHSVFNLVLTIFRWDAKVRMQQVKLRTKGLSLNREETVRYMVDKNVDKALRKVEKGFQQMEKESGFTMSDREKRIQHEADKLRLAYLSSLKVSAFLVSC